MKLLFIANNSLRNPIKGTPIRIYNILLQIKKRHNLIIYAPDAPDDLSKNLIPYHGTKRFFQIFYLARIIRVRNIEVLFNTEGTIKLAIILKFLTGVKLVIDVHGLDAEERYLEMGGPVIFLKKFLLDKKTKLFFRFYDLIFAVSGKLKGYYLKSNPNIEVIYGGVVGINSVKNTEEKLKNIFTIGYMGNARSYQGLDFLLSAVVNLKNKNIFSFKLRLILSGDKGSLSGILNKYGLFNDSIVDFNVPHEMAENMISKSDVLVIPRPSNPVTEYSYPSKLSEYLASGIPTILTEVGPVKELLAGKGISVIISSDNLSNNLERAIIDIHKMNSQARMELAKKSLKFVQENLLWDILGNKINSAIDSLKE